MGIVTGWDKICAVDCPNGPFLSSEIGEIVASSSWKEWNNLTHYCASLAEKKHVGGEPGTEARLLET